MIGALELGLLAIALALDAGAVTAGLAAGRASPRQLVFASVLFGIFQAGMAGAGAWGGVWLAGHAHGPAGVLAGLLLVAVGGRMLVGTGDDDAVQGMVGLGQLVVLAFATSIDALAAGVGLTHFEVEVTVAVLVIGLVTTGLCGVSAVAGAQVGGAFGQNAERLGGGVVVLVGLRVLVSSLL